MVGSWLRRAVLWCCRRLGGSTGLFERRLTLQGAAIAGISAVLLLAASLRLPTTFGDARHFSSWFARPRPWFTVWTVLSVWAFGLVASAVLDARRRLVITAFADGSGGDSGLKVEGFSTLVAAELALLSDLFNEFESGRALQATPGQVLAPTFQTATPDAFIEKAVTTESSFSLGPFKVPVGIVLSLVGRIVQGPRVTGQIYRDSDARVVTIRVDGPGVARVLALVDAAQRVDGDKAVWRPARDLAHDVACQLFASLVMPGAVTWQALASFAAGVRAYRDSLRTPQSRTLRLKAAERWLIGAIAQDPTFDLASYNLGVVYSELGQLDAAGIAFTRAITVNNRRWSVFYALALASHQRAREDFENARLDAARSWLSTALDYCEQALALSDDAGASAQILNLRSSVLWWRAWRLWPGGSPAQQAEFRAAGRSARQAIWRSWRALCHAELGMAGASRVSFERERARQLASRCLQDLADMALQGVRLLAAGAAASQSLSPERLARAGAVASARADLERARSMPGFIGMRVRFQLRVAGFLIRLGLAAEDLGVAMSAGSLPRWMLLRVARYTLIEARALTPEIASIHLSFGVTCLERRRYKPAIGALERAAWLAPNAADAWGYLARALTNRARLNRAQEATRRMFENLHNVSDDGLQAVTRAMERLQKVFGDVRASGDESNRLGKGTSRVRKIRMFLRMWRLGYELAERDLTQLSVGSAWLSALLQDPSRADQTIANIGMIVERAARHREFIEEVRTEKAKGAAGIDRLKVLVDEKRTRQRDWEAGHAGVALARVYERADRAAEAEACMRETIAHLENSLPSEVQRLGLYADLSRLLRLQGKPADALALAKIGVLKDPVSSFERIELGLVYSSLAEYGAAQASFETAAQLRPDDPSPQFALVSTHMRQIDDETSKAGRARRLAIASDTLNGLLEVLPTTDGRHDMLHFQLARLHTSAGRYSDAIRELRTLERRNYAPIPVALDLADAHFCSDRWPEAEQQFRRLAADLDGRIATADLKANEPVESPVDDSIVLGSAAAFARLGIAATLAERDLNLDEASREVIRARATIDEVSNADLKRDWLASCDFWHGVILLKQDRLDEAIRCLESALVVKGDAASYFQLGNALTRIAELAPAALGRVSTVRRAIRYYEEAQRVDWTGDLVRKIPAAVARAQALSPPSVAAGVS